MRAGNPYLAWRTAGLGGLDILSVPLRYPISDMTSGEPAFVLLRLMATGGDMPLGKKLWRSEDGQDITEYVLLLAIIALITASLVTAPMRNSELSSAVTTAAS